MSPRTRRPLLLLAALLALAVAAPAFAQAAPVAASAKKNTQAGHGVKRLGGHVRRAWPAPGTRRPRTPIARWLAKQVGPSTPIACDKRPKPARKRCAAGHAEDAKGAAAPRAVTAATGNGSERVQIAANRLSTGVRINTPSDIEAPLQLIRSFDIPADDPSYEQLLNWSWTYDSAVAATAFASIGLQAEAGRLLDQLAALQRKDGSIEFAFDVLTGESSDSIRAGSIAWAGIGFTDYDAQFGDDRYIGNARLAADYLLSLRNGDGLVQGGPEVTWVSTQHNLVTVIFLNNLAEQLVDADPEAAAKYKEAAELISKGIDTQLLIPNDGTTLAHFRQGVNDDVIPLDTQAIGVIYAIFRGDMDLAKQLYVYATSEFPLKDRSIVLSSKASTYNMTYEAKGPFTGFRPYLGKGAPNVLWFEGTAEMRLISRFLGDDTSALDESMNAWWDVTRKQGLAPLGADRTITRNPYNQYHVWPTAAAGAWTVLSGAAKDVDWAVAPDELKQQQLLQLLR